LIFKVLI